MLARFLEKNPKHKHLSLQVKRFFSQLKKWGQKTHHFLIPTLVKDNEKDAFLNPANVAYTIRYALENNYENVAYDLLLNTDYLPVLADKDLFEAPLLNMPYVHLLNKRLYNLLLIKNCYQWEYKLIQYLQNQRGLKDIPQKLTKATAIRKKLLSFYENLALPHEEAKYALTSKYTIVINEAKTQVIHNNPFFFLKKDIFVEKRESKNKLIRLMLSCIPFSFNDKLEEILLNSVDKLTVFTRILPPVFSGFFSRTDQRALKKIRQIYLFCEQTYADIGQALFSQLGASVDDLQETDPFFAQKAKRYEERLDNFKSLFRHQQHLISQLKRNCMQLIAPQLENKKQTSITLSRWEAALQQDENTIWTHLEKIKAKIHFYKKSHQFSLISSHPSLNPSK